LSDVTTTDANREGGEWYPKTKFIADILKENGETKLAGINHKTLIADINNENDKTQLIGEDHKQYHKTEEVGRLMPAFVKETEHPCQAYANTFSDCMRSDKYTGEYSEVAIEACFDCINEAWDDVEVGTVCLDLREVGFCHDLYTCSKTKCTPNGFTTSSKPPLCWNDTENMVNCILDYDGCDGNVYESECWNRHILPVNAYLAGI
jgi:hypothetical protein